MMRKVSRRLSLSKQRIRLRHHASCGALSTHHNVQESFRTSSSCGSHETSSNPFTRSRLTMSKCTRGAAQMVLDSRSEESYSEACASKGCVIKTTSEHNPPTPTSLDDLAAMPISASFASTAFKFAKFCASPVGQDALITAPTRHHRLDSHHRDSICSHMSSHRFGVQSRVTSYGGQMGSTTE